MTDHYSLEKETKAEPRICNGPKSPVRMSTNFRTEPPWETKAYIPPEYTIVAELPCVTWGWELDLYYWILKDQDGTLVIGRSNHGGFCLANTYSLKEQISTLSGYIEDTKSALQLIAEA